MKQTLLLAAIAATFLTASPALAGSGPTAVADRVEASSDTVHIYVLDNDSDPDDDLDSTSLALDTKPSKGKATVISTGKPRIKYDPQPGQTGEDRFTYRVCDATNLCATATVTVTIENTTTTTTTTTTSTTISTTTSTTVSATPSTSASTPEDSYPTTVPTPSDSTTKPILVSPTTTPTSSRIDAAGEAVLVSPITDTANLGDEQDIGLAATMAMLTTAGTETIRVVAVPALMGAGIAGFIATGLPQDGIAAALGWLGGRRRRTGEDDQSPGD
jgi:hypothetical protein